MRSCLHTACIAILLLVPLYDFAIYPFLYEHIPTTLKRIGAGMFEDSISLLISACLGTLQLCSSSACENNATTCFFKLAAINTSSTAGFWWIPFPITLHSIGYFLIVIFLTEFIIAQSPHPIKSLIIGLMIALTLVVGGISYHMSWVTF